MEVFYSWRGNKTLQRYNLIFSSSSRQMSVLKGVTVPEYKRFNYHFVTYNTTTNNATILMQEWVEEKQTQLFLPLWRISYQNLNLMPIGHVENWYLLRSVVNLGLPGGSHDYPVSGNIPNPTICLVTLYWKEFNTQLTISYFGFNKYKILLPSELHKYVDKYSLSYWYVQHTWLKKGFNETVGWENKQARAFLSADDEIQCLVCVIDHLW